ncbi:MAG TPA: lipopolysaccharide core heptose(I) kinase RfaP [Methylophilus sp.]|nr:lipopolysaccharide core heptose(I) kinase RfaP [Methylophilus sp.]HQQ32558.1 lipopolysaccharide core heptose(I) kinase RfaP [Methylophilus sp.]
MADILQIPDSVRDHLQGEPFDALMQLQGKAFRDVPGRKTMQVTIGGKSYFVKQHFGVGWGEILKNLLSLKKPILGAMTEVAAIQKLDATGIPNTPLVAYGQRGCNPATMQSFVLTEDLGDIITAEELSEDWQHKPAESRQALIQALAELAKRLHQAGLCHRDFYLCHFVVKKAEFEQGKLDLHLIDLHRMLQGQSPNGKSVMKDIAGLFFSGLQMGWGAEDLALFKQHYLPQSDGFWAQVEARSQALLAKFNSEKFQARLAADREKLN